MRITKRNSSPRLEISRARMKALPWGRVGSMPPSDNPKPRIRKMKTESYTRSSSQTAAMETKGTPPRRAT